MKTMSPLPDGFHIVWDEGSEEEEEEGSATITLPPVVDKLLSNLSQFSNLESFSIGFTYPYESTFTEYYHGEGMMDTGNLQAARVFKALITTTYGTLLRNKLPHFRALEIRKLVLTF